MSAKPRFLITTADERSWKKDRPVLFLGEWCRIYSRRDEWARMDAIVVKRDISLNERVSRYEYLHRLCEAMLEALVPKLNKIHHVDHSIRYWRILLAPWVFFFIPTLFDRWNSIKNTFFDCEVSGSVILKHDKKRLIPGGPHNMAEYMTSEEWNHIIYASILEHLFGIDHWEYVDIDEENKVEDVPAKGLSKGDRFIGVCSRLLRFFSRQGDVFMLGTYLPTLQEKILEINLCQSPQLWSRKYRYQNHDVNWGQRKWTVDFDASSDFESYLLSSIPRMIPTCYLEGYGDLCDSASALPWPKKPKTIFTSNILWYDTPAMAYVAEKVENGSPLVYGQHGGHYGMALKKWMEEHEMNISDRYLTWGWQTAECERNSEKIVPVGIQKKITRKETLNVNGDLLFIVASAPRYHFRIDVDADVFSYLGKCFRFADVLMGTEMYDDLLVRLYLKDYGWNEKERWMDRHPDVRLDAGAQSMEALIDKARLIVYSYNSTGYLEFFASNIPCIVLFDQDISPLREDAKPYFDELHRVGIYHESPESAVKHIRNVWSDVPGWWNSKEVQSVLEEFNKRYCARPGRLLGRIREILHDVAA